MMSNKSGLVRLTNRLGFGQIHTMSDSLRREERLRFTAHELHHRNKNLLAVVQAIANQIGSRSLSSKDYQEQFSQRLQGLSRSLDLLVEEDGCGVWMADLVRNQLQPFGEVDGVRVAAMGPAILLQPDAAQNIGLAMHELATNALKHGALSVPEGTIAVHWNLGPDATGRNCFHFTWSECGGPKVVPPPRRGFGHVVLQRMTGPALQRKVKHEFEANGVRWSLEAPAATAVSPVRQNAHLPGGHLSNVPSGANSIRT
jgi:two-component sensor histidine kinase